MTIELTKTQSDLIYSSQIRPLLEKAKSVGHPLAIITGGQAGAGKSHIANNARIFLREQGGYVIVDADKYRVLHPEYSNLISTKGAEFASAATHSVAGSWASKLMNEAREQNKNIIIDQSSRDPKAFENLSTKLRALGYEVSFKAMAVPLALSRQRCLSRELEPYIKMRSKILARGVAEDFQKLSFAGIQQTIEAVFKNKLADNIELYDRHKKIIYEAKLINGEWDNQINPSKIFQQEINRAWTKQEILEVNQKLDICNQALKNLGMQHRLSTVPDIQKDIQKLHIKSVALER